MTHPRLTALGAALLLSLATTTPSASHGAIALLEEVASGKITGEEEICSHTDLWDDRVST